MPVDFAANRKAAEKDGLISSGDKFKVKEGANRIRLLSECLPHTSYFEGQRNFKWLCYVLDRTDNGVKPYFMPHRIYKDIEALQKSEDYAFDDLPMPYDLTINAKNAGKKEVEYTVMPARQNTALTAADLAAFASKKPIRDLQEAFYAKGEAAPAEHHEATFDPDEVPF